MLGFERTHGSYAAKFDPPAEKVERNMDQDKYQKETERRFLVADRSIVNGAPCELIVQAYVFVADGFAIRVRCSWDELDAEVEPRATLTGKGPRVGTDREEYETDVSVLWARQVISRSGSVVRKRRYQVLTDQTWEVDEFLDHNSGLWIAELEGGEDIRAVPRPSWALREIFNEPMLDNEWLAVHPVSEWDADDRAAAGI